MHSTSLEVDGNQPTQPQAWLEMMNTLKASNVTLINPHEVKISQEKGVSVLDVRTSKQYAEVCCALLTVCFPSARLVMTCRGVCPTTESGHVVLYLY